MAVECIAIKSKHKTVPIPLWGQYNAVWQSIDFQQAKWLIVSNYEHWVMRMVDALTKRSVREVAQTFAAVFRMHFLAAIKLARTNDKHQHQSTDCSDGEDSHSSEDDNTDRAYMNRGRALTPLFSISIGGHQLR